MRTAAFVIAFAVAAAVLPGRLSHASGANAARDHDDFAVFYEAAQCLFVTGCDAYALRERRAPNLAPPHAHALLLPVLPLTIDRAYAAWLVLSALALAGSALLTWHVWRPPLPSARPWLAVGVVLVLGSSLTTGLVASGQLYAAMTPLVAGAWIAWRRARWNVAAVLVGAAASIKVLLLLPLAWFVFTRRFRAAAVLGLTFLGVMAAGIVAFGAETYRAWLDVLAGADRSGHFRDGSVFSALIRSLAPTDHFTAVTAAESLVIPLWSVAAGLIVAATLVRQGDPDRTWLGLLTAALLVSPKGWNYAGWWVLFPAVAVAISGSAASRTALLLAAALAWLPDRAPLWGQPRWWLTPTWGSLWLWIWLAVWLASMMPSRRPPLAAGASWASGGR